MPAEEFLNKMFLIAREGGKIALDNTADSSPTVKQDLSILTKTDTAISKLVYATLESYLKSPEHLLIDEEDSRAAEYLKQSFLESKKYIWAVDPIDGTLGYSNGLPTYGISIGVLKDLKPWLGVVYFPAFKELFYADGENAYFVKNAFTDQEIKTQIQPIDQTIDRRSVFWGQDNYLKKFDWDFSIGRILLVTCAVVDLCWPAIGRGCGALFKANIWDFAGSWPIFLKAGLQYTGRLRHRHR